MLLLFHKTLKGSRNIQGFALIRALLFEFISQFISMEAETDNEPRSSQAAVTFNCSVCTMTIADLKLKFRCTTCEQAKSADSYDQGSDFLMCEMCIQTHTRRKHDVLDYKQMEAIVCQQHFVVCSSFCVGCDQLVCNMCVVQKHAIEGHKIVPLEKQANEIKAKVHEALSGIDKEYKPIVKNLASAKKFAEKVKKMGVDMSHDDGIKVKLSQLFQDAVEEVSEDIKSVVESASSNESRANDFVKKLEEVRDSAESKQRKWRELLSFSDGRLVKEFDLNSLEILTDDVDGSLICDESFGSNEVLAVENSLKESLELTLKAFTDEMVEVLTSIAESGIDGNSSKLPLPVDCNYVKNYPNKKIEMAASDSHLCIAHFRENSDCISFKFIDKSDKATLKCVKDVDGKFFRLFSCFGGVVFQVGEKSYHAFKTSEGKIQLVDRWEIDVPNVKGFYYHKGAFQHHFYILSATASWTWQCADNLREDIRIGPADKFAVSSNIVPNSFYMAHSNHPDKIKLYIMKDQRGLTGGGQLNAQTVQPVTNIAFELFNEQPVLIAYSISENEVRFAYMHYNGDFSTGETFSKTVNLKSVLDIQFFNSDCYFLTQKGDVIRQKNFFT